MFFHNLNLFTRCDTCRSGFLVSELMASFQKPDELSPFDQRLSRTDHKGKITVRTLQQFVNLIAPDAGQCCCFYHAEIHFIFYINLSELLLSEFSLSGYPLSELLHIIHSDFVAFFYFISAHNDLPSAKNNKKSGKQRGVIQRVLLYTLYLLSVHRCHSKVEAYCSWYVLLDLSDRLFLDVSVIHIYKNLFVNFAMFNCNYSLTHFGIKIKYCEILPKSIICIPDIQIMISGIFCVKKIVFILVQSELGSCKFAS